MNKIENICFKIAIVCAIVMILSLIGFAFYDYNVAYQKCSPLKTEGECSYELCMADEYSSNSNLDEAGRCLIRTLNRGRKQ